jgi:hypothetical protein
MSSQGIATHSKLAGNGALADRATSQQAVNCPAGFMRTNRASWSCH